MKNASLQTRQIWLELFFKEVFMPIDRDFMEILACPKCKGALEEIKKPDGLVCHTCKLVYEIRDNIPIMLADEAKPYKGN